MRRYAVWLLLVVLVAACSDGGAEPQQTGPSLAPTTSSTLAASTSTTVGVDESTTTTVPAPLVAGEPLVLQADNDQPFAWLQTRVSTELADNRIGETINAEHVGDWAWESGSSWIRLFVDPCGKWQEIDWDRDPYSLDPHEERIIDDLVANGVRVMVVLDVSDDECHLVRYETEADVVQYLRWVRYIVDHLDGRVEWFEILNEPSISVDAYLNLVGRAVPLIRETNPQADIVLGAIPDTRFDWHRDWMWGVLASELMATVDGFSWHPMYGAAPSEDPRGVRQPEIPQLANYWESYPSLVGEIKAAAGASGFDGEFIAEELGWRLAGDVGDGLEPVGFSAVSSVKYYIRGIVINLGLDVRVASGFTREGDDGLSQRVVAALCTVMAGARPLEVDVVFDDAGAEVRYYAFGLPDGAKLLAVWTDGSAVDEDPGILATVTLPNLEAGAATAVDVLYDLEQELTFHVDGGDTTIPNLYIRDYPLMIRITE